MILMSNSMIPRITVRMAIIVICLCFAYYLLDLVLTKVFAEGGAILQPGVLQDISSAIMNDVPSSSDGKWPKKLYK